MNGYKKDLYLYDMEGKTVRPLTSERGVGIYLWSDRDHVLFTSDSKPGKTCFYEISISGGEARKAFELDMQVGKIALMADGRYALLGTAPVQQEPGAGADGNELAAMPAHRSRIAPMPGTARTLGIAETNRRPTRSSRKWGLRRAGALTAAPELQNAGDRSDS